MKNYLLILVFFIILFSLGCSDSNNVVHFSGNLKSQATINLLHGMNVKRTDSANIIFYENAEDLKVERWRIYDNTPDGASIKNTFDEERNSNVIELIGAKQKNGFIIGNAENRVDAWSDTRNTMLRWSVKSIDDFTIFVRLMTTKGWRYLSYQAVTKDRGLHENGRYIHYGLGNNAKNGSWQTFTRDLLSDLRHAEPDNNLLSVNAFLVRGTVSLDDIQLGTIFHVDDTTAPVLALNGHSSITVNQGEPYVELGASALDYVDGVVKVAISGYVDTSVSGINQLSYSATDLAGNKSTIIRTVKVVALDGSIIYENAEDGKIDGWRIYDDSPKYATIMNVFDIDKKSKVIKLEGEGLDNGFILGNSEGQIGSWNNSQNTKLRWSIKSSETFTVFARLMTAKGWRYLTYQSVDIERGLSANGRYIHHSLGADKTNNIWHTFNRDLVADLAHYEPDNDFKSVNAFLIRGNVFVDDIALTKGSLFDSDRDGIFDASDAFPFDSSESLDTDKDGVGNNNDDDDDEDGFSDQLEKLEGTDPLDAKSIPIGFFKGISSSSPDGTLSVYRGITNGHLIIVDNLTDKRTSIKSNRPVYSPIISNDNAYVFYLQLSEDKYYSELYRYSIKEKEVIKITDSNQGDVYNFSVSKNGAICIIAFKDGDTSQQIYTVDANTIAVDKLEISKATDQINIDMDIRLVFSSDERYVFLAVKKTIYVIDIVSKSLYVSFNLPAPAHHLSESGHFTSLKDGVYQIFKFDHNANTVLQITSSLKNKILPSISKNGDLYYIDIGAGIDQDLTSLIDLSWVSLRNSSSVYQDYLNNWGRISWQESKILRFLKNAFRVTSDPIYMNSFIDHATTVLDNMDKNQNISDYTGNSGFGWSSTRYSKDKVTPLKFVIHSAMIGIELLEFSRLLSDLSISNLQSATLVERMDVFLEGILEESLSEWREGPTDTMMIANENEGYFVFPYGGPFKYDGINLPFNMQNRYGHMLALMYERTGKVRYLEMATRIANVFKRHLTEQTDGYIWNYWWGVGAKGWSLSDGFSVNTPAYEGHNGREGRGYATVDLEFASKMAYLGVFESQEIDRLRFTLMNGPIRFNEIEAAHALGNFDKEGMESYILSKNDFLSLLPHELSIRALYGSEEGWGKTMLVYEAMEEENEVKQVLGSEGVITYNLFPNSISILKRPKGALPVRKIVGLPL